jgi:hypothetical protein
MITTNENALNDDLNNQTQGEGSNSFGTPDNGDTTNQNFSDDIDTDSGIDENALDDTEGGGNIPGSYSSNESMSGSNSPDDDDDLDLATGDDVPDDGILDDDDIDTDVDEDPDADTEADEDVNTGTTSGNYSSGSAL